jgi:hypothetical protein
MQDQYRIKFQHITDEAAARDVALGVLGIPADKISAVTICTIQDRRTNQDIGLGYGFCSKRDTFNKETGRRVALNDALTDAFPYISDRFDVNAQRVNYFLRETRRTLWNRYFSRNEGRFDPRKRRAA